MRYRGVRIEGYIEIERYRHVQSDLEIERSRDREIREIGV